MLIGTNVLYCGDAVVGDLNQLYPAKVIHSPSPGAPLADLAVEGIADDAVVTIYGVRQWHAGPAVPTAPAAGCWLYPGR